MKRSYQDCPRIQRQLRLLKLAKKEIEISEHPARAWEPKLVEEQK
jgi:hypothetical protein